MRIFRSFTEAVSEVLRDVKEMGIVVPSFSVQDFKTRGDPNYDTKEIEAYQYCVTDTTTSTDALFIFEPTREWADKEMDERLSPEWMNPGLAWKVREHVWETFLHDGRFAYSYNERLRIQLRRFIEELALRPFTRQAVLSIWNPTIDPEKLGGGGRVPCSLYYHFMVRPNMDGTIRLDMVYAMRSCDAVTHFGNDVYLATGLQEYVYQCLVNNGTFLENAGVTPEQFLRGRFIHQIASLHAFRKDWERMEKLYYAWAASRKR